jgi:UDP-N-acetylglucosamine 2-epimerase (non-hydrolysing)
MPYTERSRQNLLREGIEGQRIFVTGNPILEVINHYEPEIVKSRVHAELGLKKKKYFLVTLHRAENVDDGPRLGSLLEALDEVQREYRYPLILSLHPRTRQKIEQFGLNVKNPKVIFVDPPGFFSFIALERNAYCVLSDSGTVQEECCIFKVPNVTLRDVTERPETIECGSNILAGAETESILSCVKTVLANPLNWLPPVEYLATDVVATVCKIIKGYLSFAVQGWR